MCNLRKNKKLNIYLRIGLAIYAVSTLFKYLTGIPHILHMFLLVIAIILELYGAYKFQKN